MSFISLDLRCIFIHVQRTAGTSIHFALQPHIGQQVEIPLHPPALYVRDNWPEQWQSCFKFGFVRNPWDSWVSWYHARGNFMAKYPTFREFMLDWSTWRGSPEFRFWDQADLLCDGDGNVIVDFVGRHELLEDDFATVCKRLGLDPPPQLPVCNRSWMEHKHYRDYYDDETRAIVEEISAPTIKTFGYSF